MRRKLTGHSLIIQILPLLLSQGAWAAVESAHPGYTYDVRGERDQITQEVVLPPPLQRIETQLIDQIFTEKMSKEFSNEFRRRFGYTEFEQVQFTSNRYVQSMDSGRLVSVDEFVAKQEEFGQFMGKELTEYHVDRYLRGGRNTRKIYEVKQKISNVEVKTASGYKVKIRYRLSSNRLTLNLQRPNEKFHKQVDMGLNGDSPTVRLGYDLTQSVSLGTDLAVQDETLSLRAEKRLTASLRTSLTGQTYQKTASDGTPRQNRVLLGLSWSD